MDKSGPPTLMQGPYVPLSTSTPVHMPSDNNQYTEAAHDKTSFWQVIPNIPQQSLYPSLAAMGSSPNTALSPSIPLARRVINEIEEHQRTVLDNYAEGIDREYLVVSLDEQQVETKDTLTGPQPVDASAEVPDNMLQPESPEKEDTGIKQVDPVDVQNQDVKENAESVEINASKQQEPVITQDSQVEEVQQEPVQQESDQEELDQQDSEILEDQISRTSKDDNYQTAVDEDEQDDMIQFGNPVTQPFLSRSVRVPIIEVGCLSFTQMLQDYLRAYPSHANAYLQIQQMAQWLDVYLGKYPAQHINCMTSDSEFIAFVNHTIPLVIDLTVYPNIWVVLLILLKTQDVNTSCVQTMHDDYN